MAELRTFNADMHGLEYVAQWLSLLLANPLESAAVQGFAAKAFSGESSLVYQRSLPLRMWKQTFGQSMASADRRGQPIQFDNTQPVAVAGPALDIRAGFLVTPSIDVDECITSMQMEHP